MSSAIAKSCLFGNTQPDSAEPDHLVIHGPSWTNRMPLDDHARNVVLPALKGWIIRRHPLGWLEVITPWRPEGLQ